MNKTSLNYVEMESILCLCVAISSIEEEEVLEVFGACMIVT